MKYLNKLTMNRRYKTPQQCIKSGVKNGHIKDKRFSL